MSDALLERETLDGSELQLLIDGQPLPPLPSPVEPAPPESAAGRPRRKTSKKPFPGDELPDPEPVPG